MARINYEISRSGSKWIIKYKRTGRIIASFDWKSEAEDEVQRLIEDDNWNAANR